MKKGLLDLVILREKKGLQDYDNHDFQWEKTLVSFDQRALPLSHYSIGQASIASG